MNTITLKTFVNLTLCVVMLVAAAAPAFGAVHDNESCVANELTLEQLKAARQATGGFNSIVAAEAADYVDINLLIPNMGDHFVNFNLVDATFEPDKPEALVYADLGNGRRQLVAVEYLVPIALSPSGPPEGFAGNCDQWSPFADTFWTLHAWIWHPNMSGTFAKFNPLVP